MHSVSNSIRDALSHESGKPHKIYFMTLVYLMYYNPDKPQYASICAKVPACLRYNELYIPDVFLADYLKVDRA